MMTTTGRMRPLDPGGTALPARPFPYVAAGAGLAVVAIVIYLVVGVSSYRKKIAAAALPPPTAEEAVPAEPLATPPPSGLARNPITVRPAAAPVVAAAPDPSMATRDLEATLRQQRLWGRVEITGGRVDLRSGSCADRAMRPVIDGKAALLHDAGLTKLRCLEQSGAVVFERDL
jgi:hypothetical protein